MKKNLEVPLSNLSTININDHSQSPSARTFRRRGNTYVVKNTQSNEDVQDIYTIVDDLYEETKKMAWWADMKANIYKIMYVLCSIYIIVAGAVVGVLGINNRVVSNLSNTTTIQDFSPTNVAIIVLGFSITTFKSLLDVFTIQKRSIILKDASIKLRKIARDVNCLKTLDLTNAELLRRIEAFYTEVDGLDIIMFNNVDYVNKTDAPITNTASTSTLNTNTLTQSTSNLPANLTTNITTNPSNTPSSIVVNL